ncbi:hypothetical protein PC129_g13793 [Phytophthora cactorum]|uniref:Uncharacterized protein n=1 Tax=Phytophthora cactorum TaxID=29920 RepID=A0A8T1HT45_9STRA|nr:hypothetical protein Pcac1_g1061 [Phytophthora cactorum]KAG2801434.1 hypothetical protein PC111_g19541 [Phytophthora cactorum]KAG2811718.1 hypothetical protein PC112_g15487 [Phytophthora cactorum]KAG2882648.1 hypothetical protein PC114_g20917 [Phytophthora cactorum]KAG2990414.1 hypothetical protein PC118_g5637 [Phytophthora cactorum]
MPRRSSFTEDEEVSYLKIGEDPKTGMDQASATFWKHIHVNFAAARPAGSVIREIRSLKCKWSKIAAQTKLFSAAMDKVEHRSGVSFDDEIRDAHQVYMRREDPDGKSVVAAGVPTPENESSWIAATGQKSSKAESKDRCHNIELNRRAGKANEEIADASMKSAQAIQKACGLALFTVSVSFLDPDSRRFFELRRRPVLTRVEKDRAAEEDEATTCED